MRFSYVLAAIGASILLGASAYVYVAYRGASRDEIADLRGKSEVSVVLRDGGFEPRDLRISKGTTIVFSTDRDHRFWPASNSHPSHALYPEFDPKHLIEPGDTWSFTFDRVGQWGFHDHVRSYFTGTIYVE